MLLREKVLLGKGTATKGKESLILKRDFCEELKGLF